jgi:HEAT repeat protein
MLACGALADGALVPKFEELLFPKDALGDNAGAADAVGVAAVWGLARMRDPRALPVLRRVARSGTSAMRALAILGLGRAHDTASANEIVQMARAVDAGTVTRAAAAYALGDLGTVGAVPAVIEIAEDGESLTRRMALVSLARMARAPSKEPDWQHAAVQAMADAVFAGDPEGAQAHGAAQALSETAVAALAMVAAGADASKGGRRAGDADGTDPLEVPPSGAVDVEALLDRLALREPRSGAASDGERAAALVRFQEPIQRAALAALRASGPRATAVLDALGSGQGELLPFVPAGETGPGADAARAVATALAPSVVPLARNPDPALRMKAIVLVAHSPDPAAIEAVDAALEDSSEAVQRVALAAVGSPAGGGHAAVDERGLANSVAAVSSILAKHESWAMRILAAQALGRLGRLSPAGASSAEPRLAEAATSDGYALVRQAALEALASFDPASAKTVALRLASSDPEPRVRDAASALAR